MSTTRPGPSSPCRDRRSVEQVRGPEPRGLRGEQSCSASDGGEVVLGPPPSPLLKRRPPQVLGFLSSQRRAGPLSKLHPADWISCPLQLLQLPDLRIARCPRVSLSQVVEIPLSPKFRSSVSAIPSFIFTLTPSIAFLVSSSSPAVSCSVPHHLPTYPALDRQQQETRPQDSTTGWHLNPMAERKLLRAPFRCPSYFPRRTPCCDVDDGHDVIVCPP